MKDPEILRDEFIEDLRDSFVSGFADGYKQGLMEATKWTPVTERLPLLPKLHEKPYYVDFESELYDSDWVLVCCYVRKEPVYVVSQIIYDAKCDTYEWANLYDYAECDIDDGAVVAWMPLPEPYKGGDA